MDTLYLRYFRQKIALLIVALFFQFTLQPVKEAKAVLPLVIGGGMMIAETATGAAFLQSLAIHAAILSVGIYATVQATSPLQGSAATADKRLDVKLNPSTPLLTPAGWIAPTAPSVEPVAPSPGPSVPTYRTNAFSGLTGTTSLSCPVALTKEACVTYVLTNTSVQNNTTAVTFPIAGYAGRTCTYPGNGKSICITNDGNMVVWSAASDGAGYSANFITGLNCTSGYVVSGSLCVKSSEAAVLKPADGQCQVKRVGNSFSLDSRDPDCTSMTGVTVTNDSVKYSSQDGLRSGEIKMDATGTTSITENKPSSTAGRTERYIQNNSVPDATTGETKATGFVVQTFAGAGTAAVAVADTYTSPSSGSGSGSGSGSTSDAKDSSLQQIRGELERENGLVDTDRTQAVSQAAGIPAQLTGLAATGQDTVGALGLPTDSTYTVPVVSGVGSAMPSNNGGCVSLDVNLPYFGQLSIAPCAVVTAVRPLVDFLTIALGVLGGVFVILGRREEA